MALIEGEGIFGMDQGCELHGDDHMRECSLCGVEFCATCHVGARMCPDCAHAAAINDLEDDHDATDTREGDDLLDYEDILPGLSPDQDATGGSLPAGEEDRS